MGSVRKIVKGAGIALAVTGLVAVTAPQSASAHSGSYYKSRSGCVYTGGFSTYHSYAWTRKDSGSCSGHAWLKVQFDDGSYYENHALPGVSISDVDYGMTHAWHKSQSSESYVQSH
ncbi:hypothetical protein [Micromonospora tulbaghiae]|uniref:Lactococcin 972 family bacteriocin n=1 Tax=Micromonospora tulbaghiae TaxID=479978 RepID=A0ABY0KGK1_9ACTN|nr:hypothetical protein [Micromonospora tulbaghiae]MDX5456333.1 hypothetical protein [Micromonospora tulbaghiae]SCE69350.1 hypothetical protein GA0070562_1800 [Micromonospora tulbaghiae]